MKCRRCKKQLRKGAKFCPACGTRIEKKQKIRFTHILLIISILLGIIAIGWGGGIILAKISSTGTIKLDSKTIREAKIKVEDVTNIMDAAIDTYTDNEGYISIDAQNVALESISAQAEALFDSGKITDYSYNAGDSGIYFEIDNWLSVLYVPPIKDFMSNGDDTIEVVTLEPSAASWYLNYATSGFKGPDEAATCIIENISNFSFTQDLEDYEVSIETFVNLPKNAIVIFNGHGGCNSRIGSVLFTGVNAWDEDAMNQYSDAIDNQAIGINQEGKFYLTSRFFDNYVADNAYSGNLFYLGSCSSCADPRLAQSLWDKGARAIIGNSNTVWVNYNFQMTYSFFEGLTTKDDSGQYLPVSKALEYAKNKHGAQDSFGYGSEVLACYRDDFTLLDMIDAKKYEDALVVKVTDPPVSDVYETYISAAKNTIKDGSWSEYLVMTANMAITDGSAKTKTKVTLTSDADVFNYSESDPSQIRMSGSAEMTVMGQTYAWDMDYENGTAHYRYTKPNQTSADMKIDPSFFNFGTMTSDMMTDAKLSGNKITFTVPGDKIAEVGIAAVNQMSGVDDLEYGDVDVTVTISNEGKIDNIVMIFHASLEYQGYDADVDYNIDYRFSDTNVVEAEPTEIERTEKQLAIAKTRFSDTFTEEYIYSYNNSGQLIKQTTISYNNDAKTSTRDWDYIYNSDGKMIAEKDSENYYNDFEYHYNGSVLSGYTYNDIRENRIVIATTYHFERDAAGNVVSITTTGTDPDVWTRGKYTYDKKRQRISGDEEEKYGDHSFVRKLSYDYSYPGMVIITQEETMFDFTSTSRFIQVRDFEKNMLGTFELLDGYSIKTDKDGYITEIVDTNGTIVHTFEYNDEETTKDTRGGRYDKNAVTGYEQANRYFENEILPNYIVPTEKMTATYYCQTYGGMAGQAYVTTSTSNLYTLSQIQPWLIAYNIADYNSDRIADLFIITLEGYGDDEIGQTEIKRGIYLFDDNGQVISRVSFNTAASAAEKKMVFAFIDDKIVELSFSDYSMRCYGDNATLIEYPITDKLQYHDASINVKQFNPNTNELEFILSFYRHSYPNSSPSWDSDYSDYKTEYDAMLAVQDLLHENYIFGVEMPISDLWENRWSDDYYLTDEAEWNAFKFEISSSPSEIVYGVELVGGPRYDELELLNTTAGTTVFNWDKYELS